MVVAFPPPPPLSWPRPMGNTIPPSLKCIPVHHRPTPGGENLQLPCNSHGQHCLSLRTGVAQASTCHLLLSLPGQLRVRSLSQWLGTWSAHDLTPSQGAGSSMGSRAGFSVGLHGTWLCQYVSAYPSPLP